MTAQAHSSVERASLLGGVQWKLIPTDDRYRMSGAALEEAIKKDRENGLIPFFVSDFLSLLLLLYLRIIYFVLFFFRLYVP